ncbi:hypothetical protein PHMEG_00018784, partial [Phytophthora megakarya]
WKVFHTPPAFASTSNPIGSFNAALKHDYTLRVRMKKGTLLRRLLVCCTNVSAAARPFAVDPEPSVTLMRRANEIRRAGMLYQQLCSRRSIAFLLNNGADQDAPAQDVVRVLSRRITHIYDPEVKRSLEALPIPAQLGEQTARMKIEDLGGP